MNKAHGNTKHGMKKSRLYNIWCNMKARCNNPNHTYYHCYGAKGISVCEEWVDFASFSEWAIANGYSDTLTLDRIDPNLGYSPSNCRWVSMKTQENNRTNNKKITLNGVTHTVAEWADKIGVPYKTLYTRLFQLNWSIERALQGGN